MEADTEPIGSRLFSSVCICTRRPAKIEIPARHLCSGGFHFTPFPNSRTRVVATATRGPLASKFAGSGRSFPICLCGDVTAIHAIFRKYWPAGRQQGNRTQPQPDFLSPCWQGFIKVSLCVNRSVFSLSRGVQPLDTSAVKASRSFACSLFLVFRHFCS